MNSVTTYVKRSRISDNDRHWGPLQISPPEPRSYRSYGVNINSGKGGDEEDTGCHLDMHFGGWWVRLHLPQIIKPWREWIDLTKYEWAKNKGYWDTHNRKFGIGISPEGFVQVWHGAQTHDSLTDHTWCTHLPWTEWMHVRESLYDLSGAEVWRTDKVVGLDSFAAKRKAQESLPKAHFELQDYDGACIVATTWIEESEMHKGRGWFKWISWFVVPRIHRSMRIEFDEEVGYEKGSWKGGMMGHGIELQPGELHGAAMRRYCAAGVRNKSGISPLKFIGDATPALIQARTEEQGRRRAAARAANESNEAAKESSHG